VSIAESNGKIKKFYTKLGKKRVRKLSIGDYLACMFEMGKGKLRYFG